MASKAERGTKRTCQNGSCGARFYDLKRDPIVCPMCSTVLNVAAQATAAAPASQRRAPKKPEFVPVDLPADLQPAEADDALADVVDAEEPVAAGEEETFLEPEEDEGGDVTGIIGGAPEGEEEG